MGGKVTLITGPILSGKTLELLRHVKKYEVQARSAIIIRHTSDNDPKTLSIAKSLGLRTNFIYCDKLGDMSATHKRTVELYSQIVFIDKGELFDDLAYFCCRLADRRKHVFVAGLKCSPIRTGYKPITDLFPVCENIILLNSLCQSCFNEACFYYACIGYSEENNSIETFKTQCRTCYPV